MENPKFTICFECENEFGSHFKQESTVELFPDIGVGELDVIGEQLNTFLRQMGFIRKHDLIFMDSVTEEEQELLGDYLDSLRKKDAQPEGGAE